MKFEHGASIAKTVIEICLIAIAMTSLAVAQVAANPPLQKGIHVEMAVASHLVEVPAADEQSATVVTVAANGKVFLGINPIEITGLSRVSKGPVYVKADSRAPYQRVLTVLDALNGHPIVLLAHPASKPSGGRTVPPYGLKVIFGGQ